jgi:hypothetical protein
VQQEIQWQMSRRLTDLDNALFANEEKIVMAQQEVYVALIILIDIKSALFS